MPGQVLVRGPLLLRLRPPLKFGVGGTRPIRGWKGFPAPNGFSLVAEGGGAVWNNRSPGSRHGMPMPMELMDVGIQAQRNEREKSSANQVLSGLERLSRITRHLLDVMLTIRRLWFESQRAWYGYILFNSNRLNHLQINLWDVKRHLAIATVAV